MLLRLLNFKFPRPACLSKINEGNFQGRQLIIVHGILNPDAVKWKLVMLPPFLLLQLQNKQMLTLDDFEVLSIRQKINA